MPEKWNLGELRQQVRERFNRFEPKRWNMPALLGDGQGNVEVDGRPNYVYWRSINSGMYGVAFNNRVQPADNAPVIIGYDSLQPDLLQVLSLREVYVGTGEDVPPNVTRHHGTHEFESSGGGGDVVWVQQQQFVPLMVKPTDPKSMSVAVNAGVYVHDGGVGHFTDTTTVDLSSYKPSTVNEAIFVAIYVDATSNTLGYKAGTEFSLSSPPADPYDEVPALPQDAVPLTAVLLTESTSEIGWNNLFDLRGLTSGVSVLASYQRGSIIRGGASGWEVYSAKADGAVLVGDGTDIVSTNTPSWTGLHTFDAGIQVNGNIGVSGTVDGVDVGAHAADPAAHHAKTVDDEVYGLIRYQATAPTAAAEVVFIDSDTDELKVYDAATAGWVTVAGGGAGGDITAVYAGDGLSGGGESGDVTLSLDATYAPTFAGLTINGNILVSGTVDGVDVGAHAGSASAHHSRYSDSEAITAINNDTDHGSTAQHAHSDLSGVGASDHHARYTDGEARGAIGNIFGSDGHADANIDMDGHYLLDTGRVVVTDYIAASGGIWVGRNSDPGTDTLRVDGSSYQNFIQCSQIYCSNYIAAAGGVWVGRNSDPGTDNLRVDNYASVQGGVWVGQHTDPGTDNLRVDGKSYLYGDVDIGPNSTLFIDGGLTVRFGASCQTLSISGSIYDDSALEVDGSVVFETSNGNPTYVIQCRSTDVAHGFTNTTYSAGDTAVWYWTRKLSDSYGGAYLFGGCEAGYGIGLWIDAYVEGYGHITTGTGTSAMGAMMFRVGRSDGSGGITHVPDNYNAFTWRNGGSTRMILKTGGALHCDSYINENSYDDFDDISLVETVRTIVNPKLELKNRTKGLFEANKEILAETGVMSFEEGGSFICIQQWTYLLADTIRQMASRIELYERELIRLGADPQRLGLPAP